MITLKYLSISEKYSDAAKMTASDKKEDKVEDVEMKDESAEKEEKKDPDLLTVEDIREHCKLIRRSVESKESRLVKQTCESLCLNIYSQQIHPSCVEGSSRHQEEA